RTQRIGHATDIAPAHGGRILRRRPDAGEILDGEDHHRHALEPQKEGGEALADLRHALQRIGGDIGEDEEDEDHFDGLTDRATRLSAFEHKIGPVAQRGLAIVGVAHVAGSSAARRFSIAANASCAFVPSGPPACAMSARPPPPLPPSASAPSRTRSTALMRPVMSSVTPTTSEALPSVTAAKATTPEPILVLASSARPLRSFAETPSTRRSTALTPAIFLAPSSGPRVPPPSASALRASASSRSRRRRSSASCATRAGSSAALVLSAAAASRASSAWAER